MATLLAAVEATLLGRDERLVAKCDVPGILTVFERWVLGHLRRRHALRKSCVVVCRAATRLGTGRCAFLLGAAQGDHRPHAFSAAARDALVRVYYCASVPLVVTIKMNGKVLAARTTLPMPPAATWEAVARTRLEAVLDATEVPSFMRMPLAVSLFPTADHLPSDRVSAAISDTVAGGFALGYPHILFTLSPPVYGCARPAARGVDALARMMACMSPTHTRAALHACAASPTRARRPCTRRWAPSCQTLTNPRRREATSTMSTASSMRCATIASETALACVLVTSQRATSSCCVCATPSG